MILTFLARPNHDLGHVLYINTFTSLRLSIVLRRLVSIWVAEKKLIADWQLERCKKGAFPIRFVTVYGRTTFLPARAVRNLF